MTVEKTTELEFDVCPYYIPATDIDEPKGDCELEGECPANWLNNYWDCERFKTGIRRRVPFL